MALVAMTSASHNTFDGTNLEDSLDSGISCDLYSWQMDLFAGESPLDDHDKCFNDTVGGPDGSRNIQADEERHKSNEDETDTDLHLGDTCDDFEHNSYEMVNMFDVNDVHKEDNRMSGTNNDDVSSEKDPECCQDAKPKLPVNKKGKRITAKNKRRKDKKRPRERIKRNHKWKVLDPLDIGFHLSLISRLEDVDSAVDIDSNNPENEHTSLNIGLGAPEKYSDTSSPAREADRLSTENNINIDMDDNEAYFSALGIDVSYSGPYNDDDDDDGITDWDGLRLYQTETLGKSSTKNVSNAKTGSQASKSHFQYNHFADFPVLKNVNKSDIFRLFELECSSTQKINIRKDKDRRVQKAHKGVKSKNCTSVLNNKGKKKLYMHHRLYKKLDPLLSLSTPAGTRRLAPMPKGYENVKDGKVTSSNSNSRQPRSTTPAQNLKYALHETNAPGEMNSQLSSFLVSAQHRELTPEDYDMLLRLDDMVKPKTVSDNILKRLKTEVVPAGGLESMCAVCLEPYIAGQQRKFLNCGHDFHTNCIDTWLTNSSMNCPLDGLPVSGS